MDYNNLFKCVKCGANGSILLLKVAGSLVIIKQKCPKHGDRVIKVPLIQKNLYLNLIRDNIFLCPKCGQPASVDSVKLSGPWTLLKLNCSTHGTKLPVQKIWNSIYGEISSGAVSPKTTPQIITEKLPVQQEKRLFEVPPTTEEPPTFEVSNVEKSSTSSKEAMFCPNCGTQIRGNEKFCGTCGVEI